MNKLLLAACCGALGLSTIATADALSLLQQEVDEKTPPPPEEAEAEAPGMWYFAAAVGGNFLLDADVQDGNGTYFKFNNGVGLNLGFGYAFNKTFSLELRSGILWNGINSIQNGQLNLNGNAFTFGGGGGNVYQVPVMASLVVSIPITEKIAIGLKAGVGMQWTKFNAHDINTYAGANQVGTVGWDHNSAAFRWDIGFQLANQITHNIRIGGGLIFSGTTAVNIGAATITASPGGAIPSFMSSSDTKLDSLMNISLGFGVTVAF